jgi:hypothetical protein
LDFLNPLSLTVYSYHNIFEYDKNMNTVLNNAAQYSHWNILELLVEEKIVSYETLSDRLRIRYEEWKKFNNKNRPNS